jgi:Na+/H+ antiporter NhaC
MIRSLKSPALWAFIICLGVAYYVGKHIPPTWTVNKITLDVHLNEQGEPYFTTGEGKREKKVLIKSLVPLEDSQLHPEIIARLNQENKSPSVTTEFVYEKVDGKTSYYQSNAVSHWQYWSLLPAVVAILLCWVTREPVTSLAGGVIAGAILLGKYDITEAVLVQNLMTKSAAGIIILYLWFLGGLMGIWARTGASQAFAELMTKHVVRGPRTAKLVAWMLGIIFFQGGTVSTVLVGTTVKPLADKERISHEELAYIVDSTASPIASQLAFNAWPGYIQSFIFVAGVSWLATESARVTFFFKSVPFCFYAIFAVLGTFLLSIEKPLFLGKKLRAAMNRARESGDLDAPGAQPLSAKELQATNVPQGYKPHVIDFFLPLAILLGLAIGTFIVIGSPNVRWAFGAAVLAAMMLALLRGMSLRDLMEGIGDGFKGVVLGSVILLLAITIGAVSKEAGGGTYLVELLGNRIPYWLLPVTLQVMTMIIAFSTGTSWGTYAVAFPLAMPLAWAVANAQGLDHPEFFMTICFATVMDGSVYGDQCSPISDTTVLSSICTGCDLMDHVKTQIPQASIAAGLATICWTLVVVLFA